MTVIIRDIQMNGFLVFYIGILGLFYRMIIVLESICRRQPMAPNCHGRDGAR